VSIDPHPREAAAAVPEQAGSVPLLTLREVAEYLAVSERTVRRLIAADDLPCLRIGSQIRFDRATLLRWISARKGG
jgi:excisionase family DNA binding protein